MLKKRLGPRVSEEFRVEQHRILDMIESGAALDDVFRAIASFVEGKSPVGKCSMFILDPDGGALQIGSPPAGRSTTSDWTSPILSTEGAPLGSLTLHYSQPHVLDDDEAGAVE